MAATRLAVGVDDHRLLDQTFYQKLEPCSELHAAGELGVTVSCSAGWSWRLELEWCERKVLLGWSWSNKPVIIFSDVRALAGLRIDMSRFNQLLPVPDC